MRALRLAPFALMMAAAASHADSCDAVKATIEAKIREGGLSNFTLEAVDVAASAPAGRVVGNCAGGAKKIIQVAGGNPNGPGAAPAPKSSKVRSDDKVITECKDGTMSVGGTCKK